MKRSDWIAATASAEADECITDGETETYTVRARKELEKQEAALRVCCHSNALVIPSDHSNA